MTSEGLGEMFEDDSADMCAGKFPLMSMGGRADRQACADGERGPPLARAEIFIKLLILLFRKILSCCYSGPACSFHFVLFSSIFGEQIFYGKNSQKKH